MTQQHLHITKEELLLIAANMPDTLPPQQPLILVATKQNIKMLRPLEQPSTEPDIGYIIKYVQRKP